MALCNRARRNRSDYPSDEEGGFYCSVKKNGIIRYA